MLKAIVQPVTPFEQNASILYCSETKKCAIVDPGGDIAVSYTHLTLPTNSRV